MTSTEELTAVILNQDEDTNLGYLNHKEIQITENRELYKFDSLEITHPLTDKNNNDFTKYDAMLRAGNKVWKQQTADNRSMLFIITDSPKKKDNLKTVIVYEAAIQLQELEATDYVKQSKTVNASFINDLCKGLFTADEIELTGQTVVLDGTFTPLEVIREIENQTGGEFQFRYEYNETTTKIDRYIDFYGQIGQTHTVIIEEGVNADSISIEINELDVAIAAGPKGKPGSDDSEFHTKMATWKNYSITKGQEISLFYTKENDMWVASDQKAHAPYAKTAGLIYVECDTSSDLIAAYGKIHNPNGDDYPRIYSFDSNEAHPVNLYWECITNIRDKLVPEVNIDCNIIDIAKIQGKTPEYYNVGDTVYVRPKHVSSVIECRITQTVKNIRNPAEDKITISNNRTSILALLLENRLKNPKAIIV